MLYKGNLTLAGLQYPIVSRVASLDIRKQPFDICIKPLTVNKEIAESTQYFTKYPKENDRTIFRHKFCLYLEA